MTDLIPFAQRFGAADAHPSIDREVPGSARTGLIAVLDALEAGDYVAGWGALTAEALRCARRLKDDFDPTCGDRDKCLIAVREMTWDRFYTFCERAYRLLQTNAALDYEGNPFIEIHSLQQAQMFYTEELNEILAEENLAYQFADGQFQRRGRPQTQKTLRRVGAVLANRRYTRARTHYNKALGFFNQRPTPDEQNCIKEAVCALEGAVEVLFGSRASKDFDGAIRSKQGIGAGQIPPAIADSIIKLRAFRGSSQGVAHAASEGGAVTIVEAELVLALVGCYITYLNDRFPATEEEIPF